MSDTVKAIKSLEVDNVKVYEANGDKLLFLAKGNLEILYIAEFDRFLLRLENFKYILSSKLSVVASFSEEGAFRTYVVPNIGGHYIIKLKSVLSPTIIKNLETIFTNYSQFSYQQNHEHDLENQAHRRGEHSVISSRLHEEPLKHDAASKQPEALVQANKYIKAGGEILRQNIMKAATYIGKNLGHPKNRSVSFQSTNHLFVKSIEELKGSVSSENQYKDISKYEVTALLTLLNEQEKIMSNQSYHEIGVKMHPSSENKWPTFKKAAIDSAQTIFKGMDEAVGDLAKAVKAKRANDKIPKDKEDRIFKKIDQNIKGQAPLPMHQVSPNQQQQNSENYAKVNKSSQLQGLSSKVRSYFA